MQKGEFVAYGDFVAINEGGGKVKLTYAGKNQTDATEFFKTEMAESVNKAKEDHRVGKLKSLIDGYVKNPEHSEHYLAACQLLVLVKSLSEKSIPLPGKAEIPVNIP